MLRQRRQHNDYQTAIFEKRVDSFSEKIPEDVQVRTAQIVAAAELTAADRVLDVGTGRGVLIPYFRRYGVREIVACDLCPSMLKDAMEHYPDVVFWRGDIVDFPEKKVSLTVYFLTPCLVTSGINGSH